MSTKKQAKDLEEKGDTRHGLDGQKLQVRDFAERQGMTLVAEYEEVETGTNKKKRVEVYKAIERAKDEGATLLIADISRLARDVQFITSLQASGVSFQAIDMPSANPMTLQLMAVFAEEYARAVSKGTRRALQAIQAKGRTLGKPDNFTDEGRAKGSSYNSQKAKAHREKTEDYIGYMWKDSKTLREIADILNSKGYRTRATKRKPNGGMYYANTVKRIVDRMEEEE